MGSTSGSLRGGALDGMRFAAALLIVIYHYGCEAPVPLDGLSDVFARGYLATDFFLMLSGFVLGRAYGAQVQSGKITTTEFWLKRVKRVWPGHVIVLAVFVALFIAAGFAGVAPQHPERFEWRALAMQVALVHAWGIPGGGGWNLPSWSLSTLIVCYALFPALWRALSRVRHAWLVVALGAAGVVGSDVLAQELFDSRAFDLPLQLALLRTVPLFTVGACLARVVNDGQPAPRTAVAIGIVAAVTLVAAQALGRLDLISVACIAALVLALGRLPVERPSPLLERGAKLSFALFITHSATGMLYAGVARALSARIELQPAASWALWACSVPAAIAGAWLFDRFVDGPLQARLATRRGRARPEHLRPAPPATN